jgi:hypothetical protein
MTYEHDLGKNGKTGFRGLVLVEFLKSKLLEFVVIVFCGILCFCQLSSGSHWVLLPPGSER